MPRLRLDLREKSVQHPLSCQQRVVGGQLLRDGSHLPDGPHLHHCELLLHPLELQLHHHVLRERDARTRHVSAGRVITRPEARRTYADVVLSGRSHVGHRASVLGRQHDLVLDKRVFIDHAVDVPSCDVTASLAGMKRVNPTRARAHRAEGRRSPTRRLLLGLNSHFRSRLRAPMFTPLGM